MNAKDIAGRKFEKSFNGYRPEEVDDFLKEISVDYSSLQKENRDLEKKLEVLADKIREYRNDEDVLKEALLGAQRQGNLAISEAKEKAEKLIDEAKKNAEELIKEAEKESKNIKEENQRLVEEAKEKEKEIITEANEKADKINNDLRIQVEMQKEILMRIKEEVKDYRVKLVSGYKKHIETIESFPEQCENEYLSKITADYQKEKNIVVKKTASPAAEPDIKKPEKDAEKEKEVIFEKNNEKHDTPENLFEDFNGGKTDDKKSITFEINLDETAEIEFEPIFDNGGEADADEDYKDNDGNRLFKKPESNINNFDGKDSENLFFKKSSHTVTKNEKRLEFGNSAKTIKKK